MFFSSRTNQMSDAIIGAFNPIGLSLSQQRFRLDRRDEYDWDNDNDEDNWGRDDDD